MIHSALVAEQSHDLESLVNGSMQEASSGTVIWEDVEKETSARFAQFVYAGDYDTPLHTTMGDPSQLPPLDKAEEEPTQLEIQHGREHPKNPFQELKDAQIFRAQLPAPTLPDQFNIWERPC